MTHPAWPGAESESANKHDFDLMRDLARAGSMSSRDQLVRMITIMELLEAESGKETALRAEITRLERLVYVPGVWRCAKCKLSLVSTNLHADSGEMSANNSPQTCPNGCGPMWRKTEREAGNELCDKCEDLLKSEHALSYAYVRLRNMIPGAHETPFAPSPTQIYEITESSLRRLLDCLSSSVETTIETAALSCEVQRDSNQNIVMPLTNAAYDEACRDCAAAIRNLNKPKA
jgi:hypothetical protein